MTRTFADIRSDVLSAITTHGPLLFSAIADRFPQTDRATLRTALMGLITAGSVEVRDDRSVNVYAAVGK